MFVVIQEVEGMFNTISINIPKKVIKLIKY